MLWILLLIPLGVAVWYFYPNKPLPNGITIDKLIVYKSKRKMEAYAEDKLIKTYTVALGKNPIGHKQFEGDNRTPEGVYTINARNPKSDYHKNLGVSYPNEQDKANAEKLGKSPGGHIKVHGLRNGRGHIGKFHRLKDWTAGCIAVTDAEIDELYAAVKTDAQIHIRP